jgi:hypothetical protein
MSPEFTADSLANAEARTRSELSASLSVPLSVARDAFDLIGTLVSRIPAGPLGKFPASMHVAVLLMMRLSNDLRCVEMLTASGYPAQALSLVASMCEEAFGVGFIGTDDELAKGWLEHDDPTRIYRDVRTMALATFRNLDRPDPEGEADVAYKVYQELCIVKHANPMFTTRFGLAVEGEQVIGGNGPMSGDGAMRAGWAALEQGISMVAIAATIFLNGSIRSYISREEWQRLAGWVHALWAAQGRLQKT